MRYGGVPKLLGIAKDTVEALTAKIQEGLDADMIITSAGVSRGDYDVVKDVLAREGEIAFWTVAMKPGKPLAFGAFEGRTQDSSYRLTGQPGQLNGGVRPLRTSRDVQNDGKNGLSPADRARNRRRPHHQHRRPTCVPRAVHDHGA